jgi:hypothetical protein
MTEEEKKDYVGNAHYWLIKDALTYARLEVFGGYINHHGGLDLVDRSQMDDHRELLLFKLGRAAVSYLHSLTVEGSTNEGINAEVDRQE